MMYMYTGASASSLQPVNMVLNASKTFQASNGPPTVGPAGPSTANFVAMDGPAGLSMVAMDGPAGLSIVL